MEDSEIIALLEKRDESGLKRLEEKYGAAMRGIARGVLRREDDAEECVNDGLLAVWNAIPPAKPHSLAAYVKSIVRNISIKKYHYNTARKRSSEYEVCLEELEPYVAAVPDNCDVKGAIEKFLDSLGKTDRIVFVKRYWYFSSISLISKAVGLTEGNVRVRLSRLRKKLRDFLEKEGIAI